MKKQVGSKICKMIPQYYQEHKVESHWTKRQINR